MTSGFRNEEITYEIVDRIGMAGKKEVNIVSWCGNPPKIDIREWNGDRPKRGLTLTEDEAKALYEALKERYE